MRDVAGTAADGASPAPGAPAPLTVEVPGEGYHRGLISCQVACPVHTDARGYVRAIADGRFEEAYLIARGPNPFASICGRDLRRAVRGRLPPREGPARGRRRDTSSRHDRPIAIRALKRFVCEHAGPEVRLPAAVLDAVRALRARGLRRRRRDGGAPARRGRRAHSRRRDGRARRDHRRRAGRPLGRARPRAPRLLARRLRERARRRPACSPSACPAYRLPRELIRREVAVIEALGVEIRCGVTVGQGRLLRRAAARRTRP